MRHSDKRGIPLLPALAEVAAGRDHILTWEIARAFCCSEQTVRKQHCLTGAFYGIKPVKRDDGRLLWPVADVAARLSPEGTQ